MSEDIDLKRKSELQIKYLRNMQLIKWRMIAIGDVLSRKNHTTYKITDVEFCVLQIRKILELIAFSSLIADMDVYDKQIGDLDKKWKAELILKDIERVHKNFYPKPIDVDPQNKYQWIDKKEPYLTRRDFEKIYEKCGRYLHESKLNLTDKDIDYIYNEAWQNIPKWVELIINLLSMHLVELCDGKTSFLVQMGSNEQKPIGNILGRVEIE